MPSSASSSEHSVPQQSEEVGKALDGIYYNYNEFVSHYGFFDAFRVWEDLQATTCTRPCRHFHSGGPQLPPRWEGAVEDYRTTDWLDTEVITMETRVWSTSIGSQMVRY